MNEIIKADESRALALMEQQKKAAEICAETQKLSDNTVNFSAKREVSLMVHELRDSWLALGIESQYVNKESFSSLGALYSVPNLKSDKLIETVKAFYSLFTEVVFIELNKWLNSTYMEREFAEKLFEFCANAPRSNNSASFLINLINKLRLSSRYEEMGLLISMMEKYPNLLSGEIMPHHEYVYKPSTQHTFEKCPICGGEGEPYHRSFSYLMQHFDNPFQPFKLWIQCKECKNLYTWKFPVDFLELSTHQKKITPSENSQNAVSNIQSAHTLGIWSNILNKLRAYTEKKVLLEVGIGKGELLSVALEMNYQADAVEIVEESAQNVSDILGIPIWCGDFLNFSPDKTYSVIIMGDVIEHVTDPEAALRNAYRLLEDDGVLWLSTPNYESSFTRLKKFTDAMWNEPYHITYFNYDGLAVLLEKCGFEIREYSVSSRYNGSMELIITKKK